MSLLERHVRSAFNSRRRQSPGMSVSCRLCCKSPKTLCANFPLKDEPSDVADRCILRRTSEVASELCASRCGPPRSPRLRSGKILFGDTKRLLQHYLPIPDMMATSRRNALIRLIGTDEANSPPHQKWWRVCNSRDALGGVDLSRDRPGLSRS